MPKTATSEPTRTTPSQIVVFLFVAIVSVVGWLVWLGWHEPKHRVPGTTDFEGPYEAWQVIAYVATVAIAVVIATWFGYPQASVLGASIGTTLIFSLDAATAPSDDANMFLAGAFLLVIGAVAGYGFLAFLVGSARTGVAARSHR